MMAAVRPNFWWDGLTIRPAAELAWTTQARDVPVCERCLVNRRKANAMTIHDITIPMCDALACWPGDTPFRFSWTCTKAEGATVNVGQLNLSVHTGTHADSPFHVDDAGARSDAFDLDKFIGPARVIDVRQRARLRHEDFGVFDLAGTPRVLFRTDAWTDHARFPVSIPVMDEDVPAWLHERGVVLIGVDVPSVDAIESTSLPNHHALNRYGITILEGLDLRDVPAGVYDLLALPIKLVGADGALVRAVLRDRTGC
jgi:arylformamidase